MFYKIYVVTQNGFLFIIYSLFLIYLILNLTVHFSANLFAGLP